MILFREVYGWLRYSLSRDPLCVMNKIVAEEISSTLVSYNDLNDGVRTLAIYKADQGLTPRIELRFTGLHPQIKWIASPNNEPDGEYIQITDPYGFTGDGASWDCSDTVEALVGLAKEKFCSPAVVQLTVVNAAMEPLNKGKIIEFDSVKRIVDSVKRNAGTKPVHKKLVEDFLAKDKLGNIYDFACSVLNYFEKGKLKWDDLEALPGPPNNTNEKTEIVPWSWMKRQLSDPKFHGKLPPSVEDKIAEATANTAKNSVEAIIKAFQDGVPVSSVRHEMISMVRFGETIVASLSNGTLPINYLEAVSKCDPRETVAPWSWIARRLLANETTASEESLVDSIMAWLDESNLLMPLYRGREEERDALKTVVNAQLEAYIKNTVDNKAWLKPVVASLANLPDMDRRRALQAEFDLWLMDALSPSIAPNKIPLSAYAFSDERKDQKAYADMFSSFYRALGGWAKDYRQESLASLTSSLKNFYTEVLSTWDKPSLSEYKPKVPSVGKIIEAAKGGNRDELLTLLVADLEDEVGGEMPQEVRAKLQASPYFNSVFTEVRVQSVKL